MLLTAIRLPLLVTGVCLVLGCGQKGALYLPEQAPPTVQTKAPCRAVECNPEQDKQPEDGQTEADGVDMEINETPE